jgi:transcriptional regulator with XRE-family HTH domain
LNNIEFIGESIRILRTGKGLSQEQLALNAGVNTSYIGQIERGEKNPTIKTLEKIAVALEDILPVRGLSMSYRQYYTGHDCMQRVAGVLARFVSNYTLLFPR